MSKPEDSVGRSSADWALREKYFNELETSGRTSWESWETELRDWDPSKPNTEPSGKAISKLRDHFKNSN